MPQKACFRELGGVQNLLRPLTWHLFTKVKICTVGKRRKQIKLTPYQLFHSVSVEATLFFSPSNHRPSNFFSLFIQPPSLPNCKKSVYETKNLGFNLYLFRCLSSLFKCPPRIPSDLRVTIAKPLSSTWSSWHPASADFPLIMVTLTGHLLLMIYWGGLDKLITAAILAVSDSCWLSRGGSTQVNLFYSQGADGCQLGRKGDDDRAHKEGLVKELETLPDLLLLLALCVLRRGAWAFQSRGSECCRCICSSHSENCHTQYSDDFLGPRLRKFVLTS